MTIEARIAIAAGVGAVVALKLAAPATITEVLEARAEPERKALQLAAITAGVAVATFIILS